jgi:hypothetical protein
MDCTGALAQVREAVAAQVPGFTVERQYSNREYYVVRGMPPVAGIEPDGALARAGNRVCQLLSATSQSRGSPCSLPMQIISR